MTTTPNPLMAAAEATRDLAQAHAATTPTTHDVEVGTLAALALIQQGVGDLIARMDALEQPVVVNQTIVNPGDNRPYLTVEERAQLFDRIAASGRPEQFVAEAGAAAERARMKWENSQHVEEQWPERDPAQVEAAVDYYAQQAPKPGPGPVRTPEQRAAAAAEKGVEPFDPSTPIPEPTAEEQRAAHEFLAAEQAEEQRIIDEAKAEFERQQAADAAEGVEYPENNNARATIIRTPERQEAIAEGVDLIEPETAPEGDPVVTDLAQEARERLAAAFGPGGTLDSVQAVSSPQNAPVEVVKAGDSGIVDEAEARGQMFREATARRRPGALILNETLTAEAKRMEESNPNGLREPKEFQ